MQDITRQDFGTAMGARPSLIDRSMLIVFGAGSLLVGLVAGVLWLGYSSL